VCVCVCVYAHFAGVGWYRLQRGCLLSMTKDVPETRCRVTELSVYTPH